MTVPLPSPPPLAPALSAAEWNGVLLRKDGLAHLREEFGTLPFSAHAIAALLLFEQPFGFTRQDVQDEEEVSAYCAAMAAQHREGGDHATAAKFELLGGRHRERAAKLAALLPPV
jgi:hypothetical protein